MKLDPKLVPAWPKLAWVAESREQSASVTVWHGPCVEVRPQWAAEAVWAGSFADGDFDQTDLVFGTGIRLRGDRVVFVASGTSTDRLWHSRHKGRWYVANSLPALLAVADLCLLEDHYYLADIRTITGGLRSYKRVIPTTSSDLRVQYFHNLQYDGRQIREIEKPDVAPRFESFDDYYGFLVSTAHALARNMSDPVRQHAIHPLTSVSSGYDAAATAVIARHAGCGRAVTIRQSNSFWRGADSGEEVARYLGLSCAAYDRTARHYPHEVSVWCVSGRVNILNWTQFDYPQPLCLFFTGCRGDIVWDRTHEQPRDPFAVPSVADLGLCEFRLIRGVFHCVMPFWGLRHLREIRAIAHRPEMSPWTLYGLYDRPIARRIVEEAGVPRGGFAVRKKNSTADLYYSWPYSPDAQEAFRRFLHEQGVSAPPRWMVPILRRIVEIDWLVYKNLIAKCGLWDPSLRNRLRRRANSLLIQWSNHDMKRMYGQGLATCQADAAPADARETALARPTCSGGR